MAIVTTPGGTSYTLFKDAINRSHVLVAGTTGSGKSVVLNGLIHEILLSAPGTGPDNKQLILIDPKRVELARYKRLPHTLYHAGGQNPGEWIKAFRMALSIMDNRYKEMEPRNERLYKGGDVYVIIDEWATLFRTGGKECLDSLLRLSSEGRAARVHVLLATQFPVATILRTEIRGNFDNRFCLRTNNSTESRVVMGIPGCELLPQYGQGYWFTPQGKTLHNVPHVQDDELDHIVAHWIEQTAPSAQQKHNLTPVSTTTPVRKGVLNWLIDTITGMPLEPMI